jgi:hypothetical protein
MVFFNKKSVEVLDKWKYLNSVSNHLPELPTSEER